MAFPRLQAASTAAKTVASNVSATAARFASKVKSSSRALATTAERSAAPLVARERAMPDGVGNLVGGTVPAFAAATAAGIADSSELGIAMHDATGFLRPSDAAFVVGLVARGMGLDEKLGVVRKGNSAFIQQQVIHYGRSLGENIPSALRGFVRRKEDSKQISTSGAGPALAAPTALATPAPAPVAAQPAHTASNGASAATTAKAKAKTVEPVAADQTVS